MRFVPHGLASAIFILTTVLFSLKAQLMLTDTDFWWHLSAGDLIRGLGAIPKYDSFSFTAGDYRWLNISWAWDVFYSFLFHQGGYLPLLMTAKINALTLGFLTGFLLKRTASPVLTIITILFCVVPYSYMLTPRPHQVTFLMTIIFYIIAHNAVVEKLLKPLVLLPLLMIIWVNMHGGFIVGFVIIGAYCFESLIRRDKKTFVYFILVFVACVLATLINPLSIGIFAACARTLNSALLPIISEWQPLQLNAKYLFHAAYVFLFLITLNPLNPKTSFAEKLLSVIWAIAALKHERNLPIFVLLSAPVFALNLKFLLSGKITAWVEERDRRYHHDFSKPKVRRALFYLAILTSFVLFLGGGAFLIEAQTPPVHPRQEAEFFAENYKGRHVLNDYFQGGYLLHKLNGSSKVFIDGRAETAYPAGVVSDYLKVFYNQENWEKVIDKYQIDAAILPKDAAINQYFNQNAAWQRVYEGPLDNVFIKK